MPTCPRFVVTRVIYSDPMCYSSFSWVYLSYVDEPNEAPSLGGSGVVDVSQEWKVGRKRSEKDKRRTGHDTLAPPSEAFSAILVFGRDPHLLLCHERLELDAFTWVARTDKCKACTRIKIRP